jgi:hypothetical protein
MKKYLQSVLKQPARIAFALIALACAAVYPPLVVAAIALGTSSARLANGTQIKIAAGSPTGTFLTIANANNITWNDGSAAEVDVTNLGSDWKERLLGLPDGGIVSFECQTDLSDTGQLAAINAKNNRTKCQFQIILPAGSTPTSTFEGYVRKFNINAAVDSPVKSSCEILVTGPVVQS